MPLNFRAVARVLVLGCSVLLGSHLLAAEAVRVRWTDHPITVDGRPDDSAWQHAEKIVDFGQPWLSDGNRQATAPPQTVARLMWDHQYLYFLAQLRDEDLLAGITVHDGRTWEDDVFEIFLKPTASATGYLAFQVNAAGTRFDMFIPDRDGPRGAEQAAAHRFRWEAVVTRRGTINNSDDRDSGWIAEGRIPWTDMMAVGGRPNPGEQWSFGLSRYDYTDGDADPVLTTSSQQSTKESPDFHAHEDYRQCVFEGPPIVDFAQTGGIGPVPGVESHLQGSPEPPLDFRTARRFPDLPLNWPICVLAEPASDRLIIIDQQSPYGKTRIIRVSTDPLQSQPEILLDLDDVAYSVVCDPDFKQNRFLYVGSNGKTEDQRTVSRVTRYILPPTQGSGIDPKSARTIIDWESNGHNGAAIAFGLDGMLYVTSGDGTSDSDQNIVGQGLDHLLGKVLRIDVRDSGLTERANTEQTNGLAYRIPPDNPFYDRPGVRQETWAYGLRNPWRIAVDPVLGHIWVGNNGQDLWEQVYLARAGANYGWSLFEGSYPFYPDRTAGPDPIQKPTLEHPHSEARSLTGGVVYHGKRFPDLQGNYIYGDYSTGKIWAAKANADGEIVSHRLIADSQLQITSFAIDADGEILMTDHQAAPVGGLYTLEPGDTSPALTKPFPRRLSETGLFASVPGHVVRPGVIPYTVNSPLWSDGAIKHRYIALPPPVDGEPATIGFKPQGAWDFPAGTVLIKSFATPNSDSNGAMHWIETRLMVLRDGEWVGYSYAWDRDQRDAVLVASEGKDVEIGQSGAAEQANFRWRYPSRSECMVCHTRAAGFVLGLSTPQLNCDFDYGGEVRNQLTVMEGLGILRSDWNSLARAELQTWQQNLNSPSDDDSRGVILMEPASGQRAVAASRLLPQAPEQLQRLTNPYDETADLNLRARSYLHANCAQCHVEAGGGNAQIDLSIATDVVRMRAVDVTPLHHKFDLEQAKIIAPGASERSVLLHRMRIRGPGQMPQLATFLPDEKAIRLIADWIDRMESETPSQP
jgi:glucose/arabinose dehydrogenase